ncbi:hypothetical protein HNY73_009740 [Argiope bruennichi]|uniref:Uncharacterized protein n=1 Tax=Argiope bruennichi TaxID=94029 RepID=A0A8T0FFJ3_ARGBR|nr:hypothetical protein HNY73_009740 [Argiope bruennichi]
MDQYPCRRCGKTVAHNENHPCFLHKKFDYTYSLQWPVESDKIHDEVKDKSTDNSNDGSRCLSGAAVQNKNKKSELMNLSLFQNNERVNSLSSKDNSCMTFSENFINEQLTNSCDSSYYDPISDVQIIEVQTNENASFTASSENVEYAHSPENDQRETDENMIVVIGSGGVDLQNQRGSDNNNFSGTAKSTVNPDLSPGSNEQKNGKGQVAEDVKDENISLQMHSQGHNNNENEHISSTKEDKAVAEPSGFCPRKKKFPETFSRKDTLKMTRVRITLAVPQEIGLQVFHITASSNRNKHHDEIKTTHPGRIRMTVPVCYVQFRQNENTIELMNCAVQNNEKEKSLSSKENIGKTFSENSGKEQQRTPSDSSYFNPFSNAQLIEVQTNENASFTTSSGNVVSGYRTENNQCEAYEKMIVVTRASAIDMQKQIGSDLMHATTDEEYKMSLEKRKWQTLNNDKNSFMDSLEL